MNEKTSSSLALVVALAVLAVGFTAAGIYGGIRIPQLLEVNARGVVPPGFVAVLGEKKQYTLWLAIPDGEETPEEGLEQIEMMPPGAELRLIDLSSGDLIEIEKSVPVRRRSGGELVVSIGDFETERRGQQIQLKASGLAEPVTMSIMPKNLGQVLRVSMGLVGITVFTIVGAYTLFSLISRKLADDAERVE